MALEPNPNLDDILNRKNLERHITNGIVKVATHPTLPLYLYDYSSLCERRSAWDGVTIQTRGLMRDNKGVVVARPFQKFFSYGGKSTSAVSAFRWTDDWYATEKVDGSMIIAAQYEGELVLSTRGSFDAWQIDAALRIWPKSLIPRLGQTWVLEYVAPENRIVIEYPEPRLYFLGGIDNWTGADVPQDTSGFWTPKMYGAETVDELLKQEKNDGLREGFVVVSPRTDRPSPRLKVKYSAYNERHLEIFRKKND